MLMGSAQFPGFTVLLLGDVDRLTERNLSTRPGSGITRDQ
jgi:hypothetical protein